jgi:hypothetical protein
MTPLEVYRDYLALKNHFNTPTYDYFKYKGKSSISFDSFAKRKDKIFFEKVAKHRDPHGFMLANFIQDPKVWIRDIAYSEQAESVYQTHQKAKQGLTYLVKTELNKLQVPFDSNFIVKDHQHNHLLTLYLSKEISLETVCVLCDLTNCLPYWNKQFKDDIVWQELGLMIRKYTAFVRYDRDKIKKIVLDHFKDAG